MKIRLCILVLIAVAVSCKDDQLHGINSETRGFLLADKKWQTVALFVKNRQGIVIRDEYTSLPDYLKDNYYLLRSDSTFELNDNVTRDPLRSSQVLATGRWRLLSSESVLQFITDSADVVTEPLEIISIDAQQFSVEFPVIEGSKFMSFRSIP